MQTRSQLRHRPVRSVTAYAVYHNGGEPRKRILLVVNARVCEGTRPSRKDAFDASRYILGVRLDALGDNASV
jgi:hypothetical protein